MKTKKLISYLITFALALSLMAVIPSAVQADDTPTVTHTVTFNYGYSPSPPNFTKTVVNGDILGNEFPIAPTRNGYIFEGWIMSVSPIVYLTADTVITGDITVQGNWAPIIYNITYDLGGGTVNANPATYNIMTPTITLNNPTKVGFTFAGWVGTGLTAPTMNVTIPQGSFGDRQYSATWITYTYPTPPGYSGNDYQKLVAFALQDDNLAKLGWDLEDPETWAIGLGQPFVAWNNATPKRITTINFWGKESTGSLDISGFTALTQLLVSDSPLTAIDVTGNTALTQLYANNNLLTSIDVSTNTALTRLEVDNNQLRAIDVSNNLALIRLYARDNQLETLDVSTNDILTHLWVNNSQLTSLDVSNNTALIDLALSGNQLQTLDVSANIALQALYVDDNQLMSLDVSSNTKLALLYAENNQLTDISSLEDLPGLMIVDVRYNLLDLDDEDVQSSIEKIQATVDGFIGGRFDYTPQKCLDCELYPCECCDYCDQAPCVCLPYSTPPGYSGNDYQKLVAFALQDDNLAKLGWDLEDPAMWEYDPDDWGSNGVLWDDSVPKRITEIRLFDLDLSGRLDVSDFTELIYLDIAFNRLTSLDVSGNTALGVLDVSRNNLTSLDISGNTALTFLSAHNNRLTSLNLSNKTALQYLSVYNNRLTSLNVSNCTALKELWANDNRLTSLDLSGLSDLEMVYVHNNSLRTVDFSGCVSLKDVFASHNQLTSVTIESAELSWIDLSHNQLTSVTIESAELRWIDLSHNQLRSVDLPSSPNLTEINLENNLLKSVPDFEDSEGLRWLDISLNLLDLDNAQIQAAIEKIQKQLDDFTEEFGFPTTFNYTPQKCLDCELYPCECCPECGEYPCVCPCEDCGEYPCVCCKVCGKYPCECPRNIPTAIPGDTGDDDETDNDNGDTDSASGGSSGDSAGGDSDSDSTSDLSNNLGTFDTLEELLAAGLVPGVGDYVSVGGVRYYWDGVDWVQLDNSNDSNPSTGVGGAGVVSAVVAVAAARVNRKIK